MLNCYLLHLVLPDGEHFKLDAAASAARNCLYVRMRKMQVVEVSVVKATVAEQNPEVASLMWPSLYFNHACY